MLFDQGIPNDNLNIFIDDKIKLTFKVSKNLREVVLKSEVGGAG